MLCCQIYDACTEGYEKVSKVLLAKGASPEYGTKAFPITQDKGFTDVVPLLESCLVWEAAEANKVHSLGKLDVQEVHLETHSFGRTSLHIA